MINIRQEESSRMIHVRLDSVLHRQLRVKVAELDTSIQQWVLELIDNELNPRKKTRAKAGKK